MKTRISVFANRVFTLLVLGIISMFLAVYFGQQKNHLEVLLDMVVSLIYIYL